MPSAMVLPWAARTLLAALWASVAAVFGLLFGLLCAPVYLFSGGLGYAVSWWVSGIPYDLLHCGGNFVMALLLFVPLRKLLENLYARMGNK
jgi:energy-coupling factor transport system substrate-specific component